MKIPIRLVRGTTPRIPMEIGLRLTRVPPVVAAPPVVATPLPAALAIGAGADMFADATEIPYQAFRDVVAGYTYNREFTSEDDEPDVAEAAPHRTAWWKITVPADKVAWLTLDAQLSFGDDRNPDIHFTVHNAPNIPALITELAPLHSHEDVGHNDGAPDSGIDAYNHGWYPRLDNVKLDGSLSGNEGGTIFFVQVGQYSDASPGICYVMRFSLTEVEPGTIPPDGVDPDPLA